MSEEMLDVFTTGDIVVDRADGVAPGTPAVEDLRAINARVAVAPLSAEQVFVFRVEMSNTELDTYGTWFDVSSLRNFARDCSAPRGVPLFRNHATSPWFGMQDPHGRFFSALVEEVTTQRDPSKDKTPFARDLFNRAKGQSLRVVESAFLVRDAAPNGYPNAEIILGLVSGTAGAASIGATIDPVRAPGADLIDDITGLSVMSPECPYFPMAKYEVDGKLVRATAHFTAARQREGSLVPIGANPRAMAQRSGFETAMLNRASELVNANRLDPREATWLESVYGGHILPPRHHSIPAPAPRTEAATTHEEQPMADPAPTGGTQPPASSTPNLDTFDQLRTELDEARSTIATLEQRAIQGEQRASGLERSITDAVGLEDGEEPAEAIARAAGLITFGRAYRGDLEEQMVRAYVRAHGLADGFDRARIVGRAAHWSPDQVKEEIASLQRLAASQFKPGTTAPREVDRRGGDAPAEQPKRPTTGSPSLYRS
ncbi:MAG: hypothetical protein IT341_06995 [Chloroflexi bacterium]|nr:hypothetical protein [Chloroflexota bacterium]